MIERPRLNSLKCPRVWSVLFKLHRLHQTQQKSHAVSSSSQTISLGLKKLRESLVNFKIDETTHSDMYVYTRNSEIYLLTLEEIFDSCQTTTTTTATPTSANSNVFAAEADTSSKDEQAASAVRNSAAQQQQQRSSIMSRGSSHINIADMIDAKASIKSQNLSGDSSSATFNNNSSTNNILGTGMLSGQHSSPPDYIRLNVFGLQDPDEEMKRFLCKTLQSELDYWLLIKMCNSIEKNTYKTTSAQHPDKITDEDLQFFKQTCDNYFDYEIPLPFVFNFNRTLRENFFYFVKQIFNANFKSIDPLPTYLNSTFLAESLNTKESGGGPKSASNDEYEELSHIIAKEEFYKQSTNLGSKFTANNTMNVTSASSYDATPNKRSNAQVYTPASTINLKRTDSDTNNNILLTRIFFHNSKNMRIGKHCVSLVLVEALYSLKGLRYLAASKLTRSNSIGGSNSKQQQPVHQHPNQSSSQLPESQILENAYSQARKSGPAFVFRFYCRGDNDTNLHKLSLKSALNDALTCFLSEYLTRIEPEMYLRKIKLKKNPAMFRLSESSADIDERISKSRKRHKSTGNELSNMADMNEFR
jgi:hypothetical protein